MICFVERLRKKSWKSWK